MIRLFTAAILNCVVLTCPGVTRVDAQETKPDSLRAEYDRLIDWGKTLISKRTATFIYLGAAALRRAQLDILETSHLSTHPLFWGGFVLAGDPQ